MFPTAGSTRIPAAFDGLYALKASEHRLPQTGIAAIVSACNEYEFGAHAYSLKASRNPHGCGLHRNALKRP